MKLISSFQDYYDSAAAGNIDPKIIYLRENKIEHYPLDLFRTEWYDNEKHRYGWSMSFEAGVIGFCGKLFPFFSIGRVDYNNKDIIAWTVEDSLKLYDEQAEGRSWRAHKDISTWFASMGEKYTSLFQLHKTPAFVIRCNHRDDIPAPPSHYKGNAILEINPVLNSYGFFRAYSPYQAFQEISMYIGGVLSNNEDKIPKVQDSTRFEGKGFDNAISFRKEKSSIPKRRKHRK